MALQLHRFEFKAMACRNELSLYCSSENAARDIARRAIATVERLEQNYSRYRPDSILSQINAMAGSPEGMLLDAETSALLDYAQTCYRQSDGLFDVTSGVLRKLWNFEFRKIPRQRDVDAMQRLIGWDRLDWKPPRITLPVAGMELDFGGIVKEYAADSCANLCRGLGIRSGMVNLGGDIRVIGPHPGGKPWVVGIQDPMQPDRVIASVNLSHGGLASSGDYQRFIEVDGDRYSHLLNPKTGWPVRGLRAVSVLAPHCLVAGSTSTIAMLMGTEGKHWLATTGLAYIWVDDAGECFRHPQDEGPVE